MRAKLLKLPTPLCAILLLAILHSAHAGIRPTFSLDSCAWNATHIVLVETTSIDDGFAVKESWKGDLNPGETLVVPALRPEINAVPISRYPESEPFNHSDEYGVTGRIPRQPLGSQMILFLKRLQEPDRTSRAPNIQASSQWQPVSLYGGMKLSVVWIENGQPFCFQQWMNPGPSSLSPCIQWKRLHPPAGIERVKEVLQIQDNLVRVLELEDRDARAERLEAIVYGDVWDARIEALNGLGKTGSPALPAIRRILDKPPIPYDPRDLIRVLAEAAGEDAGKELHVQLKQDLAYWRAVGHSLRKGWWNQDATPQAPLRQKYSETIELVRELDRERYRPAAGTAAGLRDLWLSLPQLNDPNGLSQMAKECGQLVRHLSTK